MTVDNDKHAAYPHWVSVSVAPSSRSWRRPQRPGPQLPLGYLPPGWPLQHRPERVGGLAHDPAAVVVGEPGQGRLAELHLAKVPACTGRGEVGTPHDALWCEGPNDAPEELLLGRGQRIARGSGTSVQEVNRLIKQFLQARKIAKVMSGSGGRRQLAQMFRGM